MKKFRLVSKLCLFKDSGCWMFFRKSWPKWSFCPTLLLPGWWRTLVSVAGRWQSRRRTRVCGNRHTQFGYNQGRKLALVGIILIKFSSLSASTKIEKLPAGSHEKKKTSDPAVSSSIFVGAEREENLIIKDVWESIHCLRSVCFVWSATTTCWTTRLWCKQSFLVLVWPWCALPSIFCASEMGRLNNHGITALCGSSGEDENPGWSI